METRSGIDEPGAGGNARATVVAIAAGAALIAAAVGVRGEFPLSDDWSYAFATRELCETGRLTLLPWTGASLVLQVWYGAAVCRLVGFSFTALRASTVVLAALGVIGFHLLLRRAGVRGFALALGTAVLALDPLYVNLAFTFMTDVPFTVATVWAGYAYVRGLGEGRRDFLLAGATAAAGAALLRQHGILIAAAAGLAALGAGGRPARERLWDLLAATALPSIVFVAFHLWLVGSHGAPGGMVHKLTEAGGLDPRGIANATFRGLEYVGLLLVPLAPGLVGPVRQRWPGRAVALLALLGVGALVLFARERVLMFSLTPVLYDLGVGTLTLRDTLFLGFPPPLRIGTVLGVVLTVLAVGGATLVIAVSLGAARRLREPVPTFLLLAAALLFAGTLLHTRYYFDRYLLPVVPFAVAAVLVTVPLAGGRLVGGMLAALLGWYAVAGTHDYLAWNRARFAGLASLAAEGVAPTEIDGGVEFNGWHLAPTLGVWPSDDDVRVGQPPERRSWWWVVDDRFVASFRPLPGYRVWREIPYPRWLVPGSGEVLVLERMSSTPAHEHGEQTRGGGNDTRS